MPRIGYGIGCLEKLRALLAIDPSMMEIDFEMRRRRFDKIKRSAGADIHDSDVNIQILILTANFTKDIPGHLHGLLLRTCWHAPPRSSLRLRNVQLTPPSWTRATSSPAMLLNYLPSEQSARRRQISL